MYQYKTYTEHWGCEAGAADSKGRQYFWEYEYGLTREAANKYSCIIDRIKYNIIELSMYV